MKYDAVIFDLFGTLIENYVEREYRRILADMSEALSVPYDDFRRFWGETVRDRMAGRFPTTESGIEYICETIGKRASPASLSAAAKLRLNFTRSNFKPRAAALETLSGLRGLGLKIGLVTDCTCEVPTLWDETPFASLVDAPVFSCIALRTKPHPDIYHSVCEKLCVMPARCLYIGDGNSRELTGARAVGMHPVLIKSAYDLQGFQREDALEWDGPAISSLSEVLELVVK